MKQITNLKKVEQTEKSRGWGKVSRRVLHNLCCSPGATKYSRGKKIIQNFSEKVENKDKSWNI
jgi:hypothetical protein